MSKWIWILVTFLLINTVGCVGPAIDNAIDSADERIRLKWSEEWKPALIAEVKTTIADAKNTIAADMAGKLTEYQHKLDAIGVNVNDHDINRDGQMQIGETLSLLKDIKEKNDKSPTPLSWWEIAAALAAVYLPLTSAKELTKKVITKPAPAPG